MLMRYGAGVSLWIQALTASPPGYTNCTRRTFTSRAWGMVIFQGRVRHFVLGELQPMLRSRQSSLSAEPVVQGSSR